MLPYRLPGQFLDIPQVGSLLVAAQRDRHPGSTGASRSANAMNIILGHIRELEVDDVRHAFDIDPARRDIGRDQHSAAARTEAGEGALALGLRLVSVNGRGLDSVLAQLPHHPIGAVLCAGEDEHACQCRIPEQCREHLPFPVALDENDALIYQLDGRRGRRYRHLDRILEILFGERSDRSRHRRREQQGLTLRWQQRHDTPQGMNEAEIEHPIGLIKN
jgi:hypothetical protein